MLWVSAHHEKPSRDGQYYCWSHTIGKVVMGFAEGSWGGYPPVYWLKDDQSPHQAPDGSFE